MPSNQPKPILLTDEQRKDRKLIDRFLSKVNIIFEENGCWEWIGPRPGGRYGRFHYGGRYASAHRFSYSMFYGDIPDGSYILHRCDNMRCVNPAHLFLGDARSNAVDMVRKGRSPRQKLNVCDVEKIRALLGRYEHGDYVRIGEMFGVHKDVISNIHKGLRWGHVSGTCDTGNKSRKLDETQVAEIKRAFLSGATNKQIAEKYGVSRRNIANIRAGDTWKHVQI